MMASQTGPSRQSASAIQAKAWPSMLPAYDIVSAAGRLDDPNRSVKYTYPDNIAIEPPAR